MKKEKNFVDFIMLARRRPKLTEEFINTKSARKLQALFKEKGFGAISYDDCKKLAELNKGLKPLPPGKVPPLMY